LALLHVQPVHNVPHIRSFLNHCAGSVRLVVEKYVGG